MLERLKRDVCEACITLNRAFPLLIKMSSVSALDRDSGYIVTMPKDADYLSIRPADMLVVDQRGYLIEGALRPMSDVLTHTMIYKSFPNVGSVVHCCSQWATIWAQAGRDIPVYGTTHANYFHGAIPCTRKLNMFETSERYEENIGQVITETYANSSITQTPAVLVRSHGPYVFGSSPMEAVFLASMLEEVAKMAYYTEKLGNSSPIGADLIDRHFYSNHEI